MTMTDPHKALRDARKAFIDATSTAAGAEDEFAAFKALCTTVAVSALLDELDAANKAIATFCADQEWAAESWKAQKHIAPLFDIYAKRKDRT